MTIAKWAIYSTLDVKIEGCHDGEATVISGRTWQGINIFISLTYYKSPDKFYTQC
jgi:hypothetical protein